MLDLGTAQVPMGSGSLEHHREGKAVDVLAGLRPSDTLGESAGRRLTSGRARESDGGVGGKRIDDTESTKPDALAAPPPSQKTESLDVDVRETARIRCHSATLASSAQGLTPLDLIARELQTSSEQACCSAKVRTGLFPRMRPPFISPPLEKEHADRKPCCSRGRPAPDCVGSACPERSRRNAHAPASKMLALRRMRRFPRHKLASSC